MPGKKKLGAVNKICEAKGLMKDLVKYSLVLFLVCVISAAFLALVFRIAQPRIIEQRILEERRAVERVLPRIPEAIEKIERDTLVYYAAKDEAGRLIAYVLIAQAWGYSSDIRSVFSITPEGEIISVHILEHQETPGIGARIEEDEFLAQFKSRQFHEEFDAITAATISSRAVIESIKKQAEEFLKK